MIKKICIEYVKGFGEKHCFDLDIFPNKPSILVAPNGFGKSSLTAAFGSLNSVRMNIHKNHYHKDSEENEPGLWIEYKNDNEEIVELVATNASNTISTVFDIFVINNKIEAKAKRRRIGGNTIVSASMEIAPIVLTDIPQQETFGYRVTLHRENFGINGKVLPNIERLLNNKNFIRDLQEDIQSVDKAGRLVTIQAKINTFIDAVNEKGSKYTASQLISWILLNKLNELDDISYLSNIAILVESSSIYNKAESYLAAIQIVDLFKQDKEKFKKACKYKIYEFEKEGYEEIFSFFNATWKNVKPKEKDGKLILTLPKAHHISNGQRDVLTFIALLQQAKNSFRKKNCILIIDEVFDYLDDANLITVQYYITQLIKKLKAEGKNFYPLILTHLNPYYFNNYVFKKQKVYYLKNSQVDTNEQLKKLIRNRENDLIKDDVSKYLLHYHTETINKRNEFSQLGLKETWGESNNFYTYIFSEVKNYIKDYEYCPLSVSIALRIKIEELTYNLFTQEDHKEQFLNLHGTVKKLDFAEDKGINVPEVYYLLGVIYNEVAHLRKYLNDNEPIVGKLENLTIKNLIKKIFENEV